jgi:hypothetical protein
MSTVIELREVIEGKWPVERVEADIAERPKFVQGAITVIIRSSFGHMGEIDLGHVDSAASWLMGATRRATSSTRSEGYWDENKLKQRISTRTGRGGSPELRHQRRE